MKGSEIITSLITGLISGFFATQLYTINQEMRLKSRRMKHLKQFEGTYDVYHWRNLTTPDQCGYKVSVSVDITTGILTIKQTGKQSYDTLEGKIKVDDLTLTYGEGNYYHPQKNGAPSGRIHIFLNPNGTINVDKFYLDDPNQKPGYEKWQWRKTA